MHYPLCYGDTREDYTVSLSNKEVKPSRSAGHLEKPREFWHDVGKQTSSNSVRLCSELQKFSL